MNARSMGYRTGEERKLNELEQAMNAMFVERDKEPYPMHIGKTVTVHIGSGSAQGVYHGLNDEAQIVLLPSIQREEYPTKPNSGQNKIVLYWEKEIPDIAQFEDVTGVSPIRKEYLDWLVKHFKRKYSKRHKYSRPTKSFGCF